MTDPRCELCQDEGEILVGRATVLCACHEEKPALTLVKP